MRISTSMMFDTNARNLTRMQGDLYRLQNQMATGRRILTPSDDPVAAAQALVVSQQQSINQQFIDNQGNAASQLTELEDRLNGVTNVLQAVKTRVVEAGNGAYSDSDRKAIAADIRERYQELLGLANAADSMGNYVFAGFSAKTQPFSVSGSPGERTVSYQGDDGRRQLQVDASRIMDVSESGSDIFMRIPQGNGRFVVNAGTSTTPNNGTAVVGTSSMVGAYDGAKYEMVFVDADTFQVKVDGVLQVDASTSLPIDYSYTSGADVFLPDPGAPGAAEVKLSLSGTPAPGDSFHRGAGDEPRHFLDPRRNDQRARKRHCKRDATARGEIQNTNEPDQPAYWARRSTRCSHARRRSAPAGLNSYSLTSMATDLDLQYQSDFVDAPGYRTTPRRFSEIANRQMVLQAAQLTFKQVSQMSLFSYL
jgi:flagellar hook-associated protein 3 FlgL